MTTIKDFYIGENDGSGIQAKSKEEFFEYLEEKIQEAEKVGKTTFDIIIEQGDNMEKIIDDILEAADNNDMEKVNRLLDSLLED